KDVMRASGVPTAGTMSVARPPCVVKVDGLAAGKGVFVCRTQAELAAALPEAAAFGGPLVIEDLLEGEEISVFALSDGQDVVALPAAQDFKRAFDGDEGPNTGGSGSPIDGIEAAEAAGAQVFHAGTALRGGRVVTNGGRILNVTATGATLESARARAYAAADLISFEGMRYRGDIAREASLV